MKNQKKSLPWIGILLVIVIAGLGAACSAHQASDSTVAEPTARLIVQSQDLESARAEVERVGGQITHELGVIRAVGAELTLAQRAELESSPQVTRIWEDAEVRVDSLTETVRDEFDVDCIQCQRCITGKDTHIRRPRRESWQEAAEECI